MRKQFALTTVASLLVLSACSKENANGPNVETPGTATPQATAAKEPQKAPVSIRLFVGAPPNAVLPKGDDDFVIKTIKEKLNVNLTVEYMEEGKTFDDKLAVIAASGNMPDLTVLSSNSARTMVTQGIAGDLTPYVTPKTMPNYFKWITEEQLKIDQVENKFARGIVPFDEYNYQSYYIRKDWLDKLNLSVPTNYDEMLNVMRAFTNNDPDGNGKKDTYGFTAAGNGKQIPLNFPEFHKYGLYSQYFVENNKLVRTELDPRLEKVVNDLAVTLKEGLVDPDWYLNKPADAQNKVVQGRVGIIFSTEPTFALEGVPGSVENLTRAINKQADWIAFHPWGKVAVGNKSNGVSSFIISNDVSAKDPEKAKRIVELLDWFASPEAHLLTHYGIEGKHYTKAGNDITPLPDAYKKDIVDKGNFLSIYSFFTPNLPERYGFKIVDPRVTDHDKKVTETLRGYVYKPATVKLVPPEGFDAAAFNTKIFAAHSKLVFDDKSGANWPKVLDDLMNKQGGKTILTYQEGLVKASGQIK